LRDKEGGVVQVKYCTDGVEVTTHLGRTMWRRRFILL
jgi:hypothetical protein